MPKLFDSTISRQTKRGAPRIKGYYTTKEAAEALGVDPSTLRYRRDTADAKAYWELLGVSEADSVNEHLARSHMIRDGHHYYEKKDFDQFVKLYLKRPEVIRARKAKLNFLKSRTELLSYTITSDEDITRIALLLTTLLESDGSINLTVYDVT